MMNMANSEKIIRLLKIISLIELRQGASLKCLAEECDVSERTIYRDIATLSMGGMPIYFDNTTHRYRFTEKVFLKPLTFALDEAAALLQCTQAFVKEAIPLSQSLQRAQEKILACLPADRQRKVDEMRNVIDIKVTNYPYRVCTDTFSCIEQAVHEKRRLKVKYYTKSTEDLTERFLDPYIITFRGKAWYLVAYCHLRCAVKLFRIDRVKEISILPDTFAVPRNFSAAAYFDGSWFIEQGEPMKVKLRFLPEAAKWIRDGQYHQSQRIIEEDGGSLVFEVTVNGSREITKWILSFGPDVEVLEPDTLRQEVAALIKEALRCYES